MQICQRTEIYQLRKDKYRLIQVIASVSYEIVFKLVT